MSMVPVIVYIDGVRHEVGQAEVVIADGHVKIIADTTDPLGWSCFPKHFQVKVEPKVHIPTNKIMMSVDNIIRGAE